MFRKLVGIPMASHDPVIAQSTCGQPFPSEIGGGEVHLIGGRHRPQRRGVSAPVAQKAGGDWPVLRSGHWEWDDVITGQSRLKRH